MILDLSEDRLDLEILLVRGGTVFGRILGVGADEYSSFLVSVRSGAIGKQIGIRADGTYEALGLAPGDWTVVAVSLITRRSASARVTIRGPHDVIEQDLEFEDGWAVRGRFSWAGRPHVGVLVHLRSLDGRVFRQALSDYRGAFVVEGLASGSYRVLVRAPGRRTGEAEELRQLLLQSDIDLGDLEIDFVDSQP